MLAVIKKMIVEYPKRTSHTSRTRLAFFLCTQHLKTKSTVSSLYYSPLGILFLELSFEIFHQNFPLKSFPTVCFREHSRIFPSYENLLAFFFLFTTSIWKSLLEILLRVFHKFSVQKFWPDRYLISSTAIDFISLSVRRVLNIAFRPHIL